MTKRELIARLRRFARRLLRLRGERDALRDQVEALSAETDALRARIMAGCIQGPREPLPLVGARREYPN